MPRYDYKCRKCGVVRAEYNSYENRRTSKCGSCRGVSDMLPPAPNVHSFKSFNFDINPMDSVEVNTKGQLKRLCREHGKYAPGYDILEHSKEI